MIAVNWANPLVATPVWSVATIVLYLGAQRLYRRWPHWWLSPLLITPLPLIAAACLLRVSYGNYILGTHWLVALLGPATVAFAVPIYEQRALIRRHWPVLLIGVLAGSVAAIASGWLLASVFHFDAALRESLLPRSMTTPFAMEVSGTIGGIPELTAVFVVVTGVAGAALGDIVIACLPLRSALARGALFGMGAHGAGVARAREVGTEEGAVAGLIMVMVGVVNVLGSALFMHLLHQ